MPDKVDSSPALRNEADPEQYHGDVFSPLAPSRSHAHRCQTPLSPMRMKPPEHVSFVEGYLQACFRKLLRRLSVRHFLTLHAARPPSGAPRSQAVGPHRPRPAAW